MTNKKNVEHVEQAIADLRKLTEAMEKELNSKEGCGLHSFIGSHIARLNFLLHQCASSYIEAHNKEEIPAIELATLFAEIYAKESEELKKINKLGLSSKKKNEHINNKSGFLH